MPRLTFERELASLRESLVRMGTLVESQIEAALEALRRRDGSAAEKVRTQDQYLNELFRQIREQVFMVISTQQPVARDLRYLMGLQYIATELERMGDYAVRIARMTGTLVALPEKTLRAEFGLMGELAIGQVHDILEALIDQNEPRAREGGDCQGAHVDPVRRRQARRRHAQERPTVEDERDDQHVQHAAEQEAAQRGE